MLHELNQDYLYKEYNINKRSAIDIANDINCSPTTINNNLRKYNIPIRTGSESTCLATSTSIEYINEGLKQIIYGLLLGDGNLRSICKYSARYRHSDKNLEYIEWLIKLFNSYGIKTSYYDGTKTKSNVHQMWTYSIREFVNIFDKFYCNKIKVIPRDINITPITLKHHYIGDGTHNRKNKIIYIYTYGFTKEDVEYLVQQYNKLGIKFNIYKSRKYNDDRGYYLSVPKKYYNKFFDIIGECPVDCYKYKWK